MKRLLRALAGVRWGLRVLGRYVRIGFIRKSQFRWEFINQVVMDLCFYVSFVLTFRILYGLGPEGGLSLAGWSYPEMKVYLGMVFFADALMMTFLGQQWHFGADLKDGGLDMYRVRPGSTAFLYFFQRFSPEGLTNLLIAVGWLAYSLASAAREGLIDPTSLLWTLPLAVVVIAWSQVFLTMAYNILEFWVLHSGVGHMAEVVVSNAGERPLEIYPSAVTRVLQFVLPVAGLTWFPASLVLGRLEVAFVLGYPVLLLAFGGAMGWLFRRGMRRYESAMG